MKQTSRKLVYEFYDLPPDAVIQSNRLQKRCLENIHPELYALNSSKGKTRPQKDKTLSIDKTDNHYPQQLEEMSDSVSNRVTRRLPYLRQHGLVNSTIQRCASKDSDHRIVNRQDGQETTRLRCRPENSTRSNVWLAGSTYVQQGEVVIVIRSNACAEEGFAFIRTKDGIEGFIRAEYVATSLSAHARTSKRRRVHKDPQNVEDKVVTDNITTLCAIHNHPRSETSPSHSQFSKPVDLGGGNTSSQCRQSEVVPPLPPSFPSLISDKGIDTLTNRFSSQDLMTCFDYISADLRAGCLSKVNLNSERYIF
jgi:hypothetical protein